MWGSVTNFISSTVETYAADTQLGHDAIKTRLITKIDEMSTLVDDQTANMDELESLKSDKKLKEILDNLASASQELMVDLKKDSNLKPIVAVLADRVKNFGGINGFKKAVEESDSAQELKDYALKLIDIDNYSALAKLVMELQDFSKHKKTKQDALTRQIHSGQLVGKIQAENEHLKLDAVQKRVRVLVGKVCKDLELSEEHKKSLLAVFDRIIEKHLKEFNPIREELVKKLPGFLNAELKRVSGEKKTVKKGKEAVPESAAENEIDTKKAITHARKLGQTKSSVRREETKQEAKKKQKLT